MNADDETNPSVEKKDHIYTENKKYTVDRIFEKRLLILLPYHILRYEHFLKHNGTDSKKVQHLLDDFRKINRKLEETSEKEQKSHLYMDMIWK